MSYISLVLNQKRGVSATKHQGNLAYTYLKPSDQFVIFFTLQNFNYLCTPTDDSFIPRVTVNPDFSFAAVRKAVAEIKERLEEFGREELVKISKSGVTSAASPHTAGRKHQLDRPAKHKCALSCSERGPYIHYSEPNVGQEEQR